MSVVYKKSLGQQTTGIEALGGASLDGKVAIVTGGNSGIGIETVRALAYAGAKVYLTTRNLKNGEEAMKSISADSLKGQTVVCQMDLQDIKSIETFAENFLSKEKQLDYLVLNAGVVQQQLQRDQWGLESTFATNHIGHFYLTQKLLPLMSQQKIKSRIVVVSSLLHEKAPIVWDDINYETRKYDGLKAYGQSKMANVLFAKELAERYKDSGIKSYSLHPGSIRTAITRNMKFTGITFLDKFIVNIIFTIFTFWYYEKTVEQGAATTIYGCVAEEIQSQNGAYLDDCKVKKPDPFAQDSSNAHKLWEISEAVVKKITAE